MTNNNADFTNALPIISNRGHVSNYRTIMDENALQRIIGALLTARNDAKKQTAGFFSFKMRQD